MTADAFTTPSPDIDVADWLGIEVVPSRGGDRVPCQVRIRQLGRTGPWMTRDGTAQELRLYRAIVGLVRSAPVEGRDLVLDVAQLSKALTYTPAVPAEVYRSIEQLGEVAERLKRQRDDARAAVAAANEDLIAAISVFWRLRAAPTHSERQDAPGFYRQQGELTALDYVLRLLRGEEPLSGPAGRPQ